MDQQRQAFVEGAVAKKVPEKQASYIFDLVAKFAGYGFNKSHAAAYALVAYQTAYFKAHYPVEFLAASMTLDINNTDKLNTFRQDLQALGITVLPPDINKSEVTFSVERGTGQAGDRGAIRYALAAIKNAGAAAMSAIVAERRANGPYRDVADFARRVDPHNVNKRLIENLARAGAFDRLEGNRRRVFEAAELIMRHANAAASDRDSNQLGLFGGAGAEPPKVNLPAVPDWAPVDRLKEEFDAIGFYLSAHPLDAFGPSLRREGVLPIAQVLAAGQSKPVKLAGTVISRKERTSRNGGRFAWIQLSDASGMYEIMVFSELLASCRDWLETGTSLAIKATAQFEGEAVRLTAHQMEPLERLAARSAAGLKVFLDTPDGLASLRSALNGRNVAGRRSGGLVKVISRLDAVTEVEIDLPGRYAISPEIMQAVKAIPGIAEVREL